MGNYDVYTTWHNTATLYLVRLWKDSNTYSKAMLNKETFPKFRDFTFLEKKLQPYYNPISNVF